MTETTRYEITPAPSAIAAILTHVSVCVVIGALGRGGTGDALAAAVLGGGAPMSFVKHYRRLWVGKWCRRAAWRTARRSDAAPAR